MAKPKKTYTVKAALTARKKFDADMLKRKAKAAAVRQTVTHAVESTVLKGPAAGAKPITMTVVNNRINHFVVSFGRPGTIEVTLVANPVPESEVRAIVAHVYEGRTVGPNAEPLGTFDGTIEQNVDWTA